MRFFNLHAFLFLIFLIDLMPSMVYTQSYTRSESEKSLDLEYFIKSAVVKNFSIDEILVNRNNINDSLTLLKKPPVPMFERPFSQLQYAGFGYLPGELDIKIHPSDIMYPDKKWKLYQIEFPETPAGRFLVYWSSYKWYYPLERKYYWSPVSDLRNMIEKKRILVGVNEEMKEIKFISGLPLLSAIKNDFKLNTKKPQSFRSFIFLKLFYLNIDGVEFLRREKNELVFLVNITSGNIINQYEYFLDPKDPDRFIKLDYSATVHKYEQKDSLENSGHNTIQKVEVVFQNLEDKKRYLLDALMKNIYMYRMLHLDSLAERLNLDTSAWYLRPGPSDLDRLLPNYDEYLAEIRLFEYACCNTKYSFWRCFDDLPKIEGPLFGTRSGIDEKKYAWVVGFRRIYRVEFYRFYRTPEAEVLVRRPSRYTGREIRADDPWCSLEGSFGMDDGYRETSWYRYDFYYHPELKTHGEMNGRNCANYPPPPEFSPGIYSREYVEKICPPDEPRSPYDRITPTPDYYLLALDPDTREVYFISGKDIYLSRATALYRYGESPQEPEELSKWRLPEKLVYIQDRLDRYRVGRVKEEHIVEQDASKIVLRLTGSERGNPLRLRVTFYEERPELLDVEIER